MRTAKTLIRLGACPGWSESSLGAQPHCWFCHEAAHISRTISTCGSKAKTFEPRHDKTNNVAVRPAKTKISLDIHPVWSESSLSAWRKLGPLTTHWAHSEDSDQTGRMPRLIWVFAGCTLILLVLSCRGSSRLVDDGYVWYQPICCKRRKII